MYPFVIVLVLAVFGSGVSQLLLCFHSVYLPATLSTYLTSSDLTSGGPLPLIHPRRPCIISCLCQPGSLIHSIQLTYRSFMIPFPFYTYYFLLYLSVSSLSIVCLLATAVSIHVNPIYYKYFACLPAKATKYTPMFQPHGIICSWSISGADLLFFLVFDALSLESCYRNGPFHGTLFSPVSDACLSGSLSLGSSFFIRLVHQRYSATWFMSVLQHGLMGRKKHLRSVTMYLPSCEQPGETIRIYVYTHLYPRWGAVFLSLYIIVHIYIYIYIHTSGSTSQSDHHLQST